ncbi:hypothetical protein [Prescottella equi]|uniref:Uncharacterized protein n=1 Tax=Rhodococcus hoagii TaxID=43767 RepID=A0AAE5IQG8_RHOHA|nr:hypothetical protein [Prescottella equi]ERN47714.1 hypothetical protein H849_01536 [Prescottella equi NBRC 101255 = C 7]MBM4627323.1 hypothetical protein [Prescottella equi]OQQ25396.1 hypothetical protein A6410_19895 [Prescottella equi]ORL25345.1 hypothetical protein A6I89_19750 [Prescottella equi]ORL97972.1 hypothetical protein A5N73_20280 [Prescottella equi]
MDSSELSDYAVERFGDLAGVVQNAVIETVHEAQEAALRVHAEHGLPDRRPYGTSARGHLNSGLLRRLRGTPGISTAKPDGHHAEYELPIIDQTGVALYWWRVPGDGKVPVADARLRKPSRLQEHLMTLTPTAVEPQMTLEHAAMTEEELAQHFADSEHFSQQMSEASGRTVTLWVSASPDGLFDFGWGDAELSNAETGELVWARGPHSLKNAVPVTPTLKVVGREDKPVDRFDSDAEQDAGFGLSMREPQEHVSSEDQQDFNQQITGSEDS